MKKEKGHVETAEKSQMSIIKVKKKKKIGKLYIICK